MAHEHKIHRPGNGTNWRNIGRGDGENVKCQYHGDYSGEPSWDGGDMADYSWGNKAKEKGVENRPENETVKFWRRTA